MDSLFKQHVKDFFDTERTSFKFKGPGGVLNILMWIFFPQIFFMRLMFCQMLASINAIQACVIPGSDR